MIGMNWLLDKLGFYKIKANPENLKKKLHIFGDPMMLGFMIGFLIGLLGYFNELSTLSAWGSALTLSLIHI